MKISLDARQVGREFASTRVLLAAFFAILYLPFVYNYGYKFVGIEYVDLPSFWCAAKAVFRLSSSPYGRDALQALMPSQHVYPYLYPPPSLLLVYPLSLVPYQWATIATLVLNHVTVLFLLWFLPAKLFKISMREGAALIFLDLAYVLTFQPIVFTLSCGQVSLASACFIFLFWHLARTNRFFWAAACLAFALLLKTVPFILLFPLLVCKKYRIVVYAVILLAGISVVSLLLLPYELWRQWFTDVLPSMSYTGSFPPGAITNVSLNGFVSHLFLKSELNPYPLINSPILALTVGLVSSGAVFISSLYAVRKRFVRSPAGSLDWAVLIFLPLIALMSPVAWVHHLVYLLAGLLILLNLAVARETYSIKTTIFTLACAITLSVEGGIRGKFLALLGVWVISVFLAKTSRCDSPVEARRNHLE
jgi:alpha-1,2-mannosyltransferase